MAVTNFQSGVLKILVFFLLSCPIEGNAEKVFRVGIWGSANATNRIQSASRALDEAVGKKLQSIGFTEISVDSTMNFESRYFQLGQGEYALLELDPATYFLARRQWRLSDQPVQWQYDLVFQGLASPLVPSTLRGAIISLNNSELKSLEDIRSKILGILSPLGLAYGAVQLEALRRVEFEPNKDYSVVRANSESDLFKALFAGLVDGIALPDESTEVFFAAQNPPTIGSSSLIRIFKSDYLPGPLWCVHQKLARDHPNLVALLRSRLPQTWPEGSLIRTRPDYYLTTRAWLRNQD